jgi:pyridoxamine 5'-phosphate oxidase
MNNSSGNKDLHGLRVDYVKGELLERDASPDAITQFAKWFDEASAAKIPDVNAMSVATADASGRPSVRICLLKRFDESGFTFFTNIQSVKARDIAANPRVALCFWWQPLERQVRIDGVAKLVDRTEAEAYFQSRPIGSQIAASISRQSAVIESRDALERQHAELLAKHANDKAIELPEFWGGYRVIPSAIEFWQGRPSRLHDRLLYSRRADGKWMTQRLSP